MIPKIIHQTAPSNNDDWHPLWFKCQESWKHNFPEWQYRLWNDEEIDDLVKTEYTDYWEMYNDFPIHIMKIDFVRYCFMHKFGGIYADMDYFCYQNFYDNLTKEIYVVENPYGNDPIENSLMVSIPNHDFWIECMELSKYRFYEVKRKRPHLLEQLKAMSLDKQCGLKLRPMLVFYIAGTNHLSSAYRMTRLNVFTLPANEYNNNDVSYDRCFKAKHIHTGLWGEETINVTKENQTYQNYLRNIPIEKYNFYCDYSGGNYLKEKYNDIDKNNYDEKIPLSLNYNYV